MFCPKCGSNVPNGTPFCPNCGAPMNQGMPNQNAAFNAAPQQQYGMPNQQQYSAPRGNVPYGQYNAPKGNGGNSRLFKTLAIVGGILGIVLGLIFGPLFGFIPALIGLLLACGSIVLSIMASKQGEKATAGLVLGIIGAVFSFIFFVGCLSCGCIVKCTGQNAAGYYNQAQIDMAADVYTFGCLGGSCNAASKISDYSRYF